MAAALTRKCPVCGTEIQRTPDGTLSDGMRAHTEIVHPESALRPTR